MKASVEESVCAGTALCEDLCPAVFKVVDGVSRVIVDEVPVEAERDCRKALESCPTGAISIQE